ncbi:hypothetical protein AQ490_23325 [Wenjunlia vitaminophila]|uniref:Uncharacterized protein n=1 Tax=Wenjunlia vitaminophila TaxID=76728 RepID=A0A0T6LRP9_WENVI|nr:hypothetical protein [Wenjunlia vitaminophila]KRV48803.1 hypothetical protein AQ490_23325 [Wenjunlia vitaminophila]
MNRLAAGQQPLKDHCPECGKRCYASRTAARKAARVLYPGDAMCAYRCPSGWWHYGHRAPYWRRGRNPAGLRRGTR